MARNGNVDIVKFIVNQFLKKDQKDSDNIRLKVVIEIIKGFNLSEKTRNWVVKKLIDKYGCHNSIPSCSSFHWVYIEVMCLVELGVSKQTRENVLWEIIGLGWGDVASQFSQGFVKRYLTKKEIKELLKINLLSASYSPGDAESFVSIVLENGHDDLVPKVRVGFSQKQERLSMNSGC